ncbi:hypothetical protein [Aurantimonas endophytica]|jgi:hypothetical protein|uniref:Uncharacterized protein n=1 Tax=Aurantimonas endophytica TaxID=1522175 RepID=A0A7W6HF95_9HYPH|nr:hypothetical protein [Aurantimonas endophytica]MBB4004103.1 hypothetical protein [Aurantimonas endophytica]
MSRSASSFTRKVAGHIRGFASIVVHSNRCAAAVEAGRRPDPRSLKALGIDPASFDRF